MFGIDQIFFHGSTLSLKVKNIISVCQHLHDKWKRDDYDRYPSKRGMGGGGGS
jgi:hypothetical protein